VTAGGSSIPEVGRLLAVLAAGKRAAEIGTAFGLGAEALASTRLAVVDDMTPGYGPIRCATSSSGTRSS
jgi:hypothetical protein